jgi:hypothetical protein
MFGGSSSGSDTGEGGSKRSKQAQSQFQNKKGWFARPPGLPRRPKLLTVYFGTPNMFITLWFGFDYGTNPPLGTLII